MAGPWEKFGQQSAPEGPWAQFDPARVPQTVAAGQGFGDNGATWGGVQSAAHGALQGLGDETLAAVAALKETLGGGLPFGKAYEQALTMYRGARDKYREESPIAAIGSEMAGGLATGLAGGAALAPARAAGAVAPVLTGGRAAAQNAAVGAAQGGLYGFNEGEGGLPQRMTEAGQGAALGGVLGAAIPAVAGGIGRAISPVRSQLTPEKARLAEIAAAEGIDLTPGQLTGSNPLQTMESVFGTLPWTAGPQRAIQDEQRKQFNRAVLSRAGINADNASPEVISQAKSRLGSVFNDLSSRNAVQADAQLMDDLARAEAEYARNLTPDQRAIVDAYVADIRSRMAPVMSEFRDTQTHPGTTILRDVEGPGFMLGGDYQRARSAIGRRAKEATDPALSYALKSIRNSLDDAASRYVSPEDAAAWDAARRQYGNFKAVERAMKSSTNQAIEGNITPTALLQAVQQQTGAGRYAAGQGDLNDLARVGAAFVRDQIPNSGTAQRTMMQNLLTGGALTGGGAAMMVDPVTASITAALGLGGPRLAQTIYNSDIGRRYLTNQALAAAIPPATRRSLARLLAQGSGVYSGMSEDQ